MESLPLLPEFTGFGGGGRMRCMALSRSALDQVQVSYALVCRPFAADPALSFARPLQRRIELVALTVEDTQVITLMLQRRKERTARD